MWCDVRNRSGSSFACSRMRNIDCMSLTPLSLTQNCNEHAALTSARDDFTVHVKLDSRPAPLAFVHCSLSSSTIVMTTMAMRHPPFIVPIATTHWHKTPVLLPSSSSSRTRDCFTLGLPMLLLFRSFAVGMMRQSTAMLSSGHIMCMERWFFNAVPDIVSCITEK